jgi:hypothetical protein
MKEFFDATFWRFFRIGFVITSLLMLLSFLVRKFRYYGSFVFAVVLVILAFNLLKHFLELSP